MTEFYLPLIVFLGLASPSSSLHLLFVSYTVTFTILGYDIELGMTWSYFIAGLDYLIARQACSLLSLSDFS